MIWSIFEYKSGCNPYIAGDEKETAAVLEIFKNQGVKVRRIKENFYLVYDA